MRIKQVHGVCDHACYVFVARWMVHALDQSGTCVTCVHSGHHLQPMSSCDYEDKHSDLHAASTRDTMLCNSAVLCSCCQSLSRDPYSAT
jgi:hypothetical protein